MKRILAWWMVLTVVLGAIFFCCSCGRKESVAIRISVPYLVMDCIAYPECEDTRQFLEAAWEKFAASYDKYQVSLADGGVQEFEQTAYKENIPDRYNTDLAVDLTFGGYFALGSYMYDGYMIPLDDIITDKIHYEFSDATWELSRGYNGKTYMIPFYSLQNVLCYNRDLFRQCGLDQYVSDEPVIQGWSLEEWEIILSTLKKKLPENVSPMLMYAKNNQGDTHTMVQLRCKGSEFFDEKGLFCLETPKGIAGLQWIRDNYEKGYYPPACEDLEIMDCEKMFVSGQLAIYLYNSALTKEYAGMDVGYVNFPGTDSHGVNSNWVTGFMAFDNGDARKIEVIKDFLKFIFNSKELMDYSTGGDPCSRTVVERWHEMLPLDYEFQDNEDYSVDFTGNNPNWGEIREAFWPHIHALLAGEETAEQAAEGIDRDCNEAISRANRNLHE